MNKCRVSVLFDDFNVFMSMYDIVLLIFTVYVLFPVQLPFLVLIIIVIFDTIQF